MRVLLTQSVKRRKYLNNTKPPAQRLVVYSTVQRTQKKLVCESHYHLRKYSSWKDIENFLNGLATVGVARTDF